MKLKPEWSKRLWHTLDFMAGLGLTKIEVNKLVKLVDAGKAGETERVLLGSYFYRAWSEDVRHVEKLNSFVEQLLWIIDNAAANDFLKCVAYTKDMPCALIKKHWLRAVSKAKESDERGAVLCNALRFFEFHSPSIAAEIRDGF